MRLWGALPIGRVVSVVGAAPAALALTLVPLPADAPAVVIYRPSQPESTGKVVANALDELEGAALGLFPAWLPDAVGIEGPGGAGVTAVRALAMRAATATGEFGPFLADLAERSLRRTRLGSDRFSQEVRAAGLAKVVARSYGRSAAALLVEVPDAITANGEQVLVAACEWLSHRGGLGVWLSGAELSSVDWIPRRHVRLPEAVASIANNVRPARPAAQPPITYPPVAGRPHPASRAERAVERALALLPWASGRAWNQTYQARPMEPPVRLDLVWHAERCVVEVDGPEHLEPLRYEADRRRDRLLQQDGFAVARFTNDQVTRDVAVVVSQIEQLVTARRRAAVEGGQHARQG